MPKARVRLAKDVITAEQQVADEVRKEQIEVDRPRLGVVTVAGATERGAGNPSPW